MGAHRKSRGLGDVQQIQDSATILQACLTPNVILWGSAALRMAIVYAKPLRRCSDIVPKKIKAFARWIRVFSMRGGTPSIQAVFLENIR